MRTLTSPLAGLLLATSALIAPAAALAQPAGQQAGAPAPAAEPEGEVGEIVVLGRNIPVVMRETSEVANVLTTEDLVRQGDDTAATSLTRLTGLSLVSGRFVYVRGLGERYSSALLNGSPLPSPEPLQRVVPLDLFPSNILQGTLVQKTYSPEYSGEFGGGVINLQTLSIPTEAFFNMSGSVGFNGETTGRNGLTYYGSKTDWLGFDDGARDLPEPIAAAIGTGQRISEANFTSAELQTMGRSFTNAEVNLIQLNENIPPNWSVDLTGGTSFNLGWADLGVIAVGGFDNSWQTRRGIAQEGDIDIDQLVAQSDYDYTSTTQQVVLNGLFGVGLKAADHEVRWTNLYVRSTLKEARIRQGTDFNAGYEVQDSFTEWFERELVDTQLTGEHDFDPLKVNWRAAYAKATRDAPYETGIRYRIQPDGTPTHDGSQQQSYKRFSNVEDVVKSAGIDFTYAVPLSSLREVLLKGGYAYYDNQRDAVSREFRLLALNSALPADVQRERVDYLLSDFNIGPDGLVLRETTGSGGAAAYDAALKVHAGYVSADAEIMPLLRVAAGVRYEDGKQRVTTLDLFGGAPGGPDPLEESYWLPAGTLTWNFAENMQLRLGASKTIARPQFREMAPQVYLDPDVDREFIGNPFLVDSELINLDARYEWYFDTGQFFTVGAFYKDIDRPIESIINEIGSTLQQTYINAPKAVLYGAEAEIKKYFEFDGDDWFSSKRWLVAANYTYSKSKVKVSPGDVVYPVAGQGVASSADFYIVDGSRLQGQSDHLANLQLGFEDDVNRSQATLLFTYVSDRSSARGRPGEPDLTQSPGINLDFTYRQTFTVNGRDFQFGLEARNLLDEDFEEFQELGDSRVDINRYDIGRSVSVSLGLKF